MKVRDIELARQAGLYLAADVNCTPIIGLNYAEKLIALIRADEREACASAVVQAVEKGLQAAIAMEREACAKVCDEIDKESMSQWPHRLASMIRARGNT